MDKQIKAKICGKDCHLMYTMAAKFAVNEKFGGEAKAFELLSGDDNLESIETVIWLAEKLSEAGELARRYYGFDPQDYLDGDTSAETISPIEYARAKEAVVLAINLGLTGEVERESEIDIGLVELSKKKMKEKA